jgi:hypothetical protein
MTAPGFLRRLACFAGASATNKSMAPERVFPLRHSAKLVIKQGDITVEDVDAIVNAGAVVAVLPGLVDPTAHRARPFLNGSADAPARTWPEYLLWLQPMSACWEEEAWTAPSTARRDQSSSRRAPGCRKCGRACGAPPGKPGSRGEQNHIGRPAGN